MSLIGDDLDKGYAKAKPIVAKIWQVLVMLVLLATTGLLVVFSLIAHASVGVLIALWPNRWWKCAIYSFMIGAIVALQVYYG